MANPDDFHTKIVYCSYAEIVEEFNQEEDQEEGKKGGKKVYARYERLLESARAFIKVNDLSQHVICNEIVMWRLVLEYFADIKRLKEFHELKKINPIKILAYETAWLLKRKPLQIINSRDQIYIYCNEQFAYSQIRNFLIENYKSDMKEGLKFFTEFLFYHLQYRNCEPQVLELMLESFLGGQTYQRLLSTDTKK